MNTTRPTTNHLLETTELWREAAGNFIPLPKLGHPLTKEVPPNI